MPPSAATLSPSLPYPPAPVIAHVPLPQRIPQTPFDYQTAVTPDAIWVADDWHGLLVRIDLATNAVAATVPIQPSALEAGDGLVWSISPVDVAPGPETNTLSRVDLPTGIPQAVAQVAPTNRFAVGLGAVWVLDGSLVKINPATGSAQATWPLTADQVIVGCDALWAFGFSESGSFMFRVNPESGAEERLNSLPLTLDFVPEMIGTADSCWFVDRHGIQALVNGELAQPIAPPCCGDLTVAGDSLWVTADNGRIGRVDVATGQIIERWALSDEDRFHDAKGQADWRFLSAGGNLWLLTGSEAVRFNISTH